MPILSVLALAADPVPAPQLLGNWAVACDNVKRCQAVALLPPSLAGALTPLVLTRDAGPAGGVTIAIAPKGVAGRATLLIDGKPVAPAMFLETGIRITGSEAEGVARAMATGRVLEVRDYRGKRLATWSLAGASAMLRWIDAQQGRAGTLSALVARGTKQVSAVPRAAAVPTIPAFRATGDGPKIAPALIAPIQQEQACAPWANRIAPGIWRLDTKTALVVIPCTRGRVNGDLVYTMRGGKMAPAPFDFMPQDTNGIPPAAIEGGGWDTARNILIHSKTGDTGEDCGVRQQWVWDGSRFRMILKREMNTCRGATEWPVTWRATPAWR